LTPNPQRGLRHILYKKKGRFKNTDKKKGRFKNTESEAPFGGLGVET